jgi:uncharacterized UPF0146 family protein
MSKKLMFSFSSFIIVLSLMFSFVAYAEDGVETEDEDKPVACTMDAKLCSDGTSVGRTGPDCEFVCPGEEDDNSNDEDSDNSREGEIRNKFREIKGDLKDNREDVKVKRDEFKGEVEGIKDELKEKRELNKTKLKQMVESVKIEREKFKVEFELNKEQAKQKITEIRATFKEDLKNIKNEKKIASSEKIVEIILGLNTKITASLSEKTDKIENVLVSIESRATKAGDNGIDITAVTAKITKAKEVISSTREAISTQSKKVYEIGTVTDEATLKTAMKNLRDTFTKDIKALREVVKGAHMTVKDAATTLAQIPKVDEVEEAEEQKTEDTNKVEDDNTTSTTN